jgi:hypothetical protein
VRHWAQDVYHLPTHVFEMESNAETAADTEQATGNFHSDARAWRRAHCQDWIDPKLLMQGVHPSLSVSVSGPRVCTAHTGDDQVETFVLKLLRGTHLAHLHPMLPAHGSFVKPLLGVSKQQLVAYLLATVGGTGSSSSSDVWVGGPRGAWREDLSNQDPRYTRNVVRAAVVPALASVAGSHRALLRCGGLVYSEYVADIV